MNTGFFYTERPYKYTYQLKRQIVAAYQLELAQATGLKKRWLRWKRGIAMLSIPHERLYASNQFNRPVVRTLSVIACQTELRQ